MKRVEQFQVKLSSHEVQSMLYFLLLRSLLLALATYCHAVHYEWTSVRGGGDTPSKTSTRHKSMPRAKPNDRLIMHAATTRDSNIK